MSDIEQEFTISDKRFFNTDGSQREAGEKVKGEGMNSSNQAAPRSAVSDSEKNGGQKELNSGDYRNLPPVEFGSFIISLTHAAMLHMGHVSDADGSQPQPNMTLARHTIDTIAMLKNKTAGNLNENEQALIDGILTELRMLYVQTSKNIK